MKLYKVVSSNPSIIWISTDIIQERLSTDSFNENYLKWKERCIINDCFEMKKIKDISKEMNIGFTSKRDYQSTGIKFLNISNINQFSFKFDNIKFISKEVHEKLKKSQLKQGDVLLTITGTIGDSVVVPNNFGEANISANLVSIRLKENYDPYYLSVFFNSKYGKLQTKGSSKSNVWSNLGVQQVKDIEIPIPSSEIQKYIGDKVRKAEELREEAKKVESKIKNLFKSLFNIELNKSNIWYLKPGCISNRIDCEYNYNYFYELEDKFKNSGLEVVSLGNLIKKKMSEPQTNSSDFVSEGVPVLRITDIHEDNLDFDNCAKMPENVYERLKDFQLVPSDIIFGLSGTVGRAIVVPDEIPDKAITNRRIAKVTLNNPKLAHYIALFLNSEYGFVQLQRETTGGVQKNLRLEDITKVKIPLPKEEYIKEFTVKVKEKIRLLNKFKKLIQEAKQDVEDLIEGNFDILKLN